MSAGSEEFAGPEFKYAETELSLYSGEAAVFRDVYNPESGASPESNVRAES